MAPPIDLAGGVDGAVVVVGSVFSVSLSWRRTDHTMRSTVWATATAAFFLPSSPNRRIRRRSRAPGRVLVLNVAQAASTITDDRCWLPLRLPAFIRFPADSRLAGASPPAPGQQLTGTGDPFTRPQTGIAGPTFRTRQGVRRHRDLTYRALCATRFGRRRGRDVR